MMPTDPFPTKAEIDGAKALGLTIRQYRDRQPEKRARAAPAPKVVPPELPALEPGQWRITLPMPPSLTNSGKGRSRNPHTIAGEKRAYYARLDEQLMVKLLPDPPAAPLPFATLAVTMYLGNPMDEENAAARCKWPIDWLVTRGYLAGDSRRHLRWAGMPEQVVQRGQVYRITFTLTPTR